MSIVRAQFYVLMTLSAFGLAAAHPAAAQTYSGKTINATDSVEAAGLTSGLPNGSTAPTGYLVAPDATVTFASVTGMITFNGGGNFNNADGIGSASSYGVNAFNGVSSISGDHAGELVGVFTGPAGPIGPAPAGLDFTDSGSASGTNTDFASFSPVLDQAFFIGDGLTGNGTGTAQQFIAPAGATELYLGFADAQGYFGDPGSYGDNSGTLTATFTATTPLSATPEPSAVTGIAFGMLSLAALGLRARRRAANVA